MKLATDDGFRMAYKLDTKKRSIDLLREAYRRNNVEASAEPLNRGNDRRRSGMVVIASVEMSLRLASGRGGSLLAEYFTRDLGRRWKPPIDLRRLGLGLT
jgi:hypothetical protein